MTPETQLDLFQSPQQGPPPTAPVKPPADAIRLIQPYPITKRDAGFRRNLRKERGDKCERCGASGEDAGIHCHHLLETKEFPEFAKEPANIVVVCDRCHASVTSATHRTVWEHDCKREDICEFYAGMPFEVRSRVAGFLKQHAPHLSGIIATCGG